MKLKTLGEVAEYINGRAFKPMEWEESGLPIIRIQNLNNNDAKYNYTNSIFEDKYLVRNGDLLFAWSASLGAFIWNGSDAWLNQHIFKVVPHEGTNKIYLFYYLIHVIDELYSKTHGSGMVHITLKPFKATTIPLPHPVEQQRTVECIESLFEKLDRAKELVKSVLDSFETRKAAILHKAFNGEMTAKWRKENGLSIDGWVETTISNVCTVNPKRIDVTGIDDNVSVSFVPMTVVSDALGEITNYLSRTLNEVKKGYTSFKEGDVIFAKITPCMENGKSAIVGELENDIGFGSTEFHVLRCKPNLDRKFIYHFIRNQQFRDEARAVMTGAVGQQRVPKSFIEDYLINLPTIPEQQEIVRILDGLLANEQQAKELCGVIEKIDLMKKAILARAFRGELGTNDTTEESAVKQLECVLSEEES